MKTLYGYILRELVPPTLLGLALFTFVLLMDFFLELADQMIELGIGLADAGRFLVYSLPHIFVMTVPMAVLLGGLIAFGRLSSDSEVVAMRTGGISLYRLAVPMLVVGAVAWLLNIWLSVVAMPWGNNEFRQLQWRLSVTNARAVTAEIKPRLFHDEFPNIMLWIEEVADGGQTWEGVFLARTDTNPRTVMTAARATPIFDEEARSLYLNMENVLSYRGGRDEAAFVLERSGSQVVQIMGPSDFPDPGDVSKDDRSMNLAELREAVAQRRAEGESAAGFLVEIHKKFALPGACLVLGLLALPLGVSTRRQSRSTGFVLAILVIAVYYVFIENGEKAAEQGLMAPWLGLWSANIVLGTVGVLLLWSKAREVDWGVADRLGRLSDRALQLAAMARRRIRGALGRGGDTLADDDGPPTTAARAGGGFPRILDRLVLSQFVRIFALALGGLLTIWILVDYFERADDVYEAGADPWIMVEYFRYLTPYILHMTVPIAVLVTVLTVFSLMSRNNEVVAVLSGGTSLYRLVLPMLLPAVLLTVGDYLLQEYVLPETTRHVQEIKEELSLGSSGQGAGIRGGTGWGWAAVPTPAGRQILSYADFDEQRHVFRGLNVYHLRRDGAAITREEHADRVEWEDGAWMAHDGWRQYHPVGTAPGSGSTASEALAAADAQPIQTFKVLPLSELRVEPAYFASEARPPDLMTTAELVRYIDDLEQRGYETVRYRVDLQQKAAEPAIILVMALVAIPFGFRMGRQGTLSGIGVAIAIAVVFWISFVMFGALGKAEILPPVLAAWATHAIFLALAGYLALGLET